MQVRHISQFALATISDFDINKDLAPFSASADGQALNGW